MKLDKPPTYLVVKLLQQAVQPGLGHLHGPSLVGYVADFYENHHQLRQDKQSAVFSKCVYDAGFYSDRISCSVSHHVSVLLVAKVESWQDGFEFVQDLVVPRHVRGQDAPAGRAEWGTVETP